MSCEHVWRLSFDISIDFKTIFVTYFCIKCVEQHVISYDIVNLEDLDGVVGYGIEVESLMNR